MKISAIAIPYAKALFDLSNERNELETVAKDMKAVADVISQNRDFLLMLKSPVIQSERKQKVISEIFKNNISALTFTFLSIIVKNKREKFLPDMAEAFVELYKDFKGILTTHVRTAVPVTPEIRQEIIGVMKNYTGKEIDLIEDIQEDLIGGFVLNWKDKQYDASILNQINKLKKGSARINLFVKKL